MNQEIIRKCICNWFNMVGMTFQDEGKAIRVILPHLVSFRPDKKYPETLDINFQEQELREEFLRCILEDLVSEENSLKDRIFFSCRPNGSTEDGACWFQFHVELVVPKS